MLQNMHIYFDWETSWKDKKKRQEMGDTIETGIIEMSFEDTTWTVCSRRVKM
jgi:hypothetical protein